MTKTVLHNCETFFGGRTKRSTREKNHHFKQPSPFPFPSFLFLSGGGRGDKSCFDAGAVRGLAREDSKHRLCRTFKINPSATGLETPPLPPLASQSPPPLSLFPRAVLPLFLSPLSVMCLLLSENRGST